MSMIAMRIREKGFTLIEVLVTMLILSIGLFGILAVIMTSLKMNSSSVYRTIAAQQANAMAEILRANPTTVGTPSAASGIAFSSSAASGLAPAITQNCLNATGCAQSAVVNTTIKLWQDQLAALLPPTSVQPQGTICQDSSPNDGAPGNWKCNGPTGTQTPTDQNAPYVVKVCWNESRINASSSVTSGNAGYSANSPAAGEVDLCTYTSL